MKQVRYIVGAIGFLLVWFVVAVVIGFIVTIIFPTTNGGTTRLGIIFDWRNLPGVILGLLAGIQSFRTSVRHPKMKDGLIAGIMGTFRQIIIGGGCLIILFIGGCAISTYCHIRSFDHLEQNARKVIAGSELQAWAVQVVAQYPAPTNGYMDLRLSDLAAPLPKPLLGLYHRPPDVYVYETAKDDPGHVRLIWGGGLMGHCGFEIGPTNFVGRGHPWQPGVYFWSEFDRK